MACTRSGRVRKRAAPVERMLARVFREAVARVRFNAFLRDMNVGVAASDARRIEVLAQDLPCFGVSQLAVDVTLRSALGCSGEPQQGAADIDGQSCFRHVGTRRPLARNWWRPTGADSLWWPWKPERRGLRHLQAVGICASSGRAPIHEVASRSGVGTTMDPHVGDNLCGVLCSLTCVTFRTV